MAEKIDLTCPDCGRAVDEEWNFCVSCGRVLKYPCCGNREIAPTDTCCSRCGKKLSLTGE